MTENDIRDIKMRCLRDLREHLVVVKDRLDAIDERLYLYVADAVREDMDTANVYELLGIRKVFRLMATYEVNVAMVQRWLVAIEGHWRCEKSSAVETALNVGRWCWVSGGLSYDTPRGHTHVRLMPYQVWCVFGMMAFMHDVCLEREDDGNLLATEWVDENGIVWDKRRLCTEAHIFQTRKSGKTEFGASLDFVEANVLGPSNAQVLVAANSKDQAKIAFKAIKQFSFQLDPAATSKAGGKYLRVTADETTWRNGLGRTAEIKVMSAGGKKKDGLYASWVHADEHGSADYVNEHSDMQDLVEVCAGSMGPRRERMLLHTTTAGLVNEGPYQLQLRVVENSLLGEMAYTLGDCAKTAEDGWFAFLLRLDPWDFNGDVAALNKDNLFRKVNRSIGITVQPTWYKDRIHAAMTKGEDTKKEVLTKDFNIWQNDVSVEWVNGDDIRKLQKPMRIDDCLSEDDWIVFAGLDFSMGNDLHAVSYLGVRYHDEGENQWTEFFADMDAWVSEEGLSLTPYRPLYEKWIANGWLHLSPGATLEPSLPVQRIAELYEKGVELGGFGYDSYKAKIPINALSAWLVEITGDVKIPKDMVVPVSQTFASYNPVVEEMDYMIKSDPPLIAFSDNPMWAWEFGNAMLAIDSRYDNKKPVKRGEYEKVDNVQCLLSALMMFDRADGRAVEF